MYADGDIWTGPMTGPRSVQADNINLLATEPYANTNNEGLPLRSTTYEAKTTVTATFQEGSFYIQDPNTTGGGDSRVGSNATSGFCDLYGLSLSQVYAMGYRSYLYKLKQKNETHFHFPSAQPDFDGSAPTNPEAVAQYVRNLAVVYRSVRSDPIPFNIYQHIILENANGLLAIPINRAPQCGSTNSPDHMNLDDPEASPELPTEGTPPFTSIPPKLAAEAFTLSLSLAGLKKMNHQEMHILLRKMQADVCVASAIDGNVVSSILTDLKDILAEETMPLESKSQVCALVGMLVSPRGIIKEVLQYLQILEDFHASCTNILPLPVPLAAGIVGAFTFHAKSFCAITSPIDCFQEEPVNLKVSLWEGIAVHCFCVSPNGRLLAVATSNGPAVFEFASGFSLHHYAGGHMEQSTSYWNITFSEDSAHFICTDTHGRSHTVYTADATAVKEFNSDEVAIPLDYRDGALVMQHSPLLPSGSNRSLFFFAETPLLVTVSDVSSDPMESLTVCAHLFQDFEGTLVQFFTDNGSMAVHFKQGRVELVQGGVTCYGIAFTRTPWLFIHANWKKGVWSLHVNSNIVELHGPRNGQNKVVAISKILCLSGVGHIGSLAAWSHPTDVSAANHYGRGRRLAPHVLALVNLPLDEGKGLWIKETVGKTSFLIPETQCTWDDTVLLPLPVSTNATTVEKPIVHLDPKLLLEGRVLTSSFKLCIILPSAIKGGDDVVAEVDRDTNIINRVYRCPRACSENIYALLSDESELIVYQQRFSTFSSVRLHSIQAKTNELAMNGLLDAAASVNSVDWLLHEWYKKIYLECSELHRIPAEYSPLSLSNLVTLTHILQVVKPNTHKLRVLAILSLTLVHFQRLGIANERQLTQVAMTLKNACTQIMDLFTEKAIHNAASQLLYATTSKSLTLHDRVQALIQVNVEHNSAALNMCITKESLEMVIHHIVPTSPGMLLKVTRGLLALSRAEEGNKEPAERPITRLMVWFVLTCVTTLMLHEKFEVISQLLELFIGLAEEELEKALAQGGDLIWRTVLHTGGVPLLIVVAHLCPCAMTTKMEQGLLQLLHTLEGTRRDSGVVSFSTREACDVFPPIRESTAMWRFAIDFSRARDVTVLKEPSTPSFSIIRTGGEESEFSNISMDGERTFVRTEGGHLVFFGSGETNFTINARFDFHVDTSWAGLFRECVQNLLVLHAQNLTQKPKTSDVHITSLLRQGLNTPTLRRHDIDLDTRMPQPSTLAMEILKNVDNGKVFVDQVYQSMRGSIVPSMRPAMQALLAILIHSGTCTQQAEDELKLRWFSGEWGSKLQGPNRDVTHTFLTDFATWCINSLYYQLDSVPTATTRRVSADRRFDSSMNTSRSISERRGSCSSRRVVLKSTQQSDTLDQVKTLLTKGVSPVALEAALVERTRAAMKMSRGLEILHEVLSLESMALASETSLLPILEVLWDFANVYSGTHYTETLSGSGLDLEMQVRVALHSVLARCQQLLLRNYSKTITPQEVLTDPAHNGKATMQLLAILCHSWDAVDAELFNANLETQHDLLKQLEDQMNTTLCNLALIDSWSLRDEAQGNLSKSEAYSICTKLTGLADLSSLSSIYPNDFSVVIPQLQTSRSDEGLLIEKNSISATVLCADEGWPLSWSEGVPWVYYYEVKVKALAGTLCIGLAFSKTDIGFFGVNSLYFYSSSGATHGTSFPSFSEDDTVGCGVVTTNRRIFFTLNGMLLGYRETMHEQQDTLFPTLRFDEHTGVQVLVNFGTTAFAYDYRQLNPALNLVGGPTWYCVASMAAVTMHHISVRACAMQETRKASARVFFMHCCDAVFRNIKSVTDSLMGIGLDCPSSSDTATRMKQSVIRTAEEPFALMLIATMRHIVGIGAQCVPLPTTASNMVFDAASMLALLPLHSIKIATISILPEIIPHVRYVPDATRAADLVSMLFQHANAKTSETEMIPFTPMWCECDPRCMSIANVNFAYMTPEAQRSIVLGNILPRTGVVSFSVRVTRRNMSKGHSLKGGYFIGVSIVGLNPLSPTSNSQSWKAAKPPVAWALHDTSPQLPHATNPTVRPNNFQRTFGNDDTIRVVVDRDNRSIDFYRDDEFLKTLFNNVPADIDLVPFVQLYNDDATAIISPGEMTTPISIDTLLSATSVDVLRAMLKLEQFQFLVAKGLCKELDTRTYPKVALALFNSVPDPRVLQLHNHSGEDFFITVRRVSDMRCKFSIGNEANYEHLYNLRAPANPKITCFFDSQFPCDPSGGLSLCVERLIAVVRRVVVPSITTQALCALEQEERRKTIEEESDRWDFLFYGLRVGSFLNIQRASQLKPLIAAPRIPIDYTFSAALSHPSFQMPPTYCGRLATVPNGSKSVATPFIAVAAPSIPTHGIFSIRCQLIRGHNGQILGGGYYFGVCTASFNWKRKDLNTGLFDVWAIHDMDDTPWRLRHIHPSCVLPVTADPRCIIVSGDIIRLEINRDEGTIRAFRKPINGEEVPFGLIYNNLPAGTLYPFVHLFNVDAVAVLLPSNSADPAIRLTVQQPSLLTYTVTERRYCDGCTAQHIESCLHKQWYKCNECADYALCKNCFDLCTHSYHTFTDMGAHIFAHSVSAPKTIHKGMEVIIPATTCMYLRSSGCRMYEEHMNCVAESVDANAFVMWGMVCKGRSQFTAIVETTDHTPLTVDHPMFIGVGFVEEVMHLSREKLRNKCFSTQPSVLAYCSDPTMRREMEVENRQPHGFESGSTITIEVDMVKKSATFIRNWIVVGTQTLELPSAAPTTTTAAPLCCFVVFGRKNVQVSIFPERAPLLLAMVEESNGSMLKVTSGPDSRIRYVTAENCRLPLHPCVVPPPPTMVDRLCYIFVDKHLMQCRVVAVEEDIAVVRLVQDHSVRNVHFARLLVDDQNVIAEERFKHKESDEQGVTLLDGFVVSRLLLILSTLCESETLSSLVMQRSAELVSMIKGLASVQIGNDAPLEFLNEIRAFVANTANSVRWITPEQRLRPFVPTLGTEDRKQRLKQGMLVRRAMPPASRDNYRLVLRKGEMLVLQHLVTGKRVELHCKNCIPVKQCGGKPWYNVKNGLPCSLMEHTVRLMRPDSATVSLSLEGEWQGEVSFPKTKSILFDIHLASDGVGTAVLSMQRHKLSFYVVYEYLRYQRLVSLFFLSTAAMDARAFEEVVHAEGPGAYRRTVQQLLEVVAHETTGADYYKVETEIDAEGVRMNGTCRSKDSKMGDFVCNWAKRTSFASIFTDIACIEPLPDCVDTVVVTAPQRNLSEALFRLIILLARHLYLVLCSKMNTISKEFVENVFLFNMHPLADRLVTHFVGMPQLFFMVWKASQMIVDPNVKPWDAATLSNLITKTLLLRPESSAAAPPSLVWDALHAVVMAVHRCGSQYRHEILRKITTFVQCHPKAPSKVYHQLFGVLFTYIDRHALAFTAEFNGTRKEVSSGVDLILALHTDHLWRLRNIPTQPLHCLIDLWKSLSEGQPLPRVVDEREDEDDANDLQVNIMCVFGDYKDDELKVGKIMSSIAASLPGRYYYEVVLPDRLTSPFAVGWGTQNHCDVPSQHVGSDRASFSYNGSDITTKDTKEEYKITTEIMPGCVIGCLLDLEEKSVAWSINGTVGPFIPVPITLGDEGLYAFASIGTCSGMRVRLEACDFEYVPDGYTDFSKRHTRILVEDYDKAARSTLPVMDMVFYAHLTAYLSQMEEIQQQEESVKKKMAASSSNLSTTIYPTAELYLTNYPILVGIDKTQLVAHARVISIIESCMATASRFVDLDSDTVSGMLSLAFLYLKPLVRRSFREKLLVKIPGVEKVGSPPIISIRVTELFSTLPRTPDVALQRTVLAQLYKQIGSFSEGQWSQSPLFKVHLYISGSGHAPIDMGGPYRQVWTYLAEEIMRHPDRCYPYSDFHRNPLFCFVNNSQRVSLVPDIFANSSFELTLFNFFGKIMGHAARAKFPLDIDFSSFLWKFLVDDVLTIRDYYQHVDSVVERSMEDDNFLLSGVAEEIIPNFAENILYAEEDELGESKIAQRRRSIAENCLVHSMDEQLSALRSGLWSVLPRRVVRCLFWRDLERLVCGESNPTIEELKRYIRPQLSLTRERYFWQIVEEMTAEQKAALLCFASGQRRLPLIRPISIQENNESVEHLPRAQSCSTLITIPPYNSLETFREKLLVAVQHQGEMELA